jgi:hypothetical protein
MMTRKPLALPDMNGYDLARTARGRRGERTTLIAPALRAARG